jgi:hypothetical protein
MPLNSLAAPGGPALQSHAVKQADAPSATHDNNHERRAIRADGRVQTVG